jgi:hypothetical protein
LIKFKKEDFEANWSVWDWAVKTSDFELGTAGSDRLAPTPTPTPKS